jgi:hypothetical protein
MNGNLKLNHDNFCQQNAEMTGKNHAYSSYQTVQTMLWPNIKIFKSFKSITYKIHDEAGTAVANYFTSTGITNSGVSLLS